MLKEAIELLTELTKVYNNYKKDLPDEVIAYIEQQDEVITLCVNKINSLTIENNKLIQMVKGKHNV